MIKILTIALGLQDVSIGGVTVSGEVLAVGICFLITLLYSVAAGMWAVLWTDLVQFVIKMSAVIVLAVYAVDAVGGIDVHEGEAGRPLRQRGGRALGAAGARGRGRAARLCVDAAA